MNLQMIYDLRNAEKALPAKVKKCIEESSSVLDEAECRLAPAETLRAAVRDGVCLRLLA